MNFSLFDVYATRHLQGFSIGYMSCGTTETALLAVMIGHGELPDGTPATIATVEVLFSSLIKNTVSSFLDMFKKKDTETKDK